MVSAMAPENVSDGLSASVRFLLLLFGEAIAGVFLYAVFTFMPVAVQIVPTLTSWAVIANDNIFHPQKNKSLGSLLCAITAILFVACGVVWRMNHKDLWWRLTLTGACLTAGLILLDRRADG